MGASTDVLEPNRTASYVREQLASLSSVGVISVTLRSNAADEERRATRANATAEGVDLTSQQLEEQVLERVSWCENASANYSSGAELAVEFRTELQDLPLMRVQLLRGYPGVVSVTSAVDGAGAPIECSGRGMCDRARGLCECFSGYVSGDGGGAKGARGDCGAQDIHFIRPGDETYAPTIL